MALVQVFGVTHGNSQQCFALKEILRTHSTSIVLHYCVIINEFWVMTNLRHAHIVEFLGSNIHSDCLSLLTAPVAGTDLCKFLTKDMPSRSSLFLDRSKILVRGISSIVAALDYIHSTPACGSYMAHMDLKPANVLIKNSSFLIADFGIFKFRFLDKIPTTDNIQVAPEYTSPEKEKIRNNDIRMMFDRWGVSSSKSSQSSWVRICRTLQSSAERSSVTYLLTRF